MTEKFKRNNRPDLRNLSFSIVFVEKGQGERQTLDLVSQGEREFQAWTKH